MGILIHGSGVIFEGENSGFTLQNNAHQGMLISNTSNVVIENIISTGNGASGLEVLNSTGVSLITASALDSNGAYGLWVNSSSGNQFFSLEASDNHLAGAFVGETNTLRNPTRNAGAKSTDPSQRNSFVGGGMIHNGQGGIVIGLGDTDNVITTMEGQANEGDDAIDQNGDCSSNSWTKNLFITVSPSCIQ